MKSAGGTLAMAAASVLALSACSTNERMGQVIGGILGAGAGYAAAGDDDDTMKAIAVVAGASLGAWIGGNIGRGLDQRERERLAISTQQVLAADVPPNSPLRSSRASEYGPASAHAPSSSWSSPTNPETVSGKSTLLGVTSTDAGECRMVRQLVIRNGKETSEDARFCRSGPSAPWKQS